MKKIVFLLLISYGINAQTKIKYSQMENPATSSVNLGAQTFSVSTITGSVSIGTGTVAANTSSLGIVRIKQGSSWVDIGESVSGFAALFMNTTNSGSNHFLLSNSTGSSKYVNAPSSLNLSIGGIDKLAINSGGAALTGSFSASGTSTLTGAAKQTNTLNYEGNTTWNTNQTNTLTTGNTGTVAVLSDASFNLRMMTVGGNPADGITYIFGGSPTGWIQTVGQGRVYMPYNCTLVGWSATFQENGGAGTTESATLNIVVNTTATVLSSAITLSGVTGTLYDAYTGSGLSQNVAAGDYITASLICPTWATNPTGVVTGITFWFVRRQ